ncbi:hypothetical protein [Teredinibacter turnerae]|uniref:Uncharacterized protein n=1 Tax=Teredinibacter turnerae (strain ATCC 39867 / T7901) TaxID=377629 RepID=C5BJ17_TERTT|nr:hypothetical protein [Teredinibacter turnerae]ACR13467.1 Conserved hypothetical protein [Teredinibacter turnerae T7901]
MIRFKKRDLMVVGFAVAVVAISVISTLLVAGGPEINAWLRGNSNKYMNVTFTDAVLTCQAEVAEQFGRRMTTMEVDNHSSRYDSRRSIYKIFLEVTTPAKADATGVHYVNCFVKSSNGRISNYESWEEKEGKNGPVGHDSNPFGFPR